MVALAAASPVGVYYVVRELDPFWAAALRFVAAGLIFWIAMISLRIRLPRGRALFGAVLYGVVGFFLAFAFVFWGMKETPPGTAGLLLAIVPLFTILLARLHRLEAVRIRSIVGATIALGGIGIIVADRISLDVPVLSVLALIAASLCLAESSIILKLTPRIDPIATNAIALTVGGLMLALLSLIIGESWVLPRTGESWLSMGFLIVGGSVGVFGLYVFVLSRWSATAVSYELLLSAVITPVYSALLTDEIFTWSLAFGGMVVLAGVYVGVFARRRPAIGPPEAMPITRSDADPPA